LIEGLTVVVVVVVVVVVNRILEGEYAESGLDARACARGKTK
jgi:hypothetical protein